MIYMNERTRCNKKHLNHRYLKQHLKEVWTWELRWLRQEI